MVPHQDQYKPATDSPTDQTETDAVFDHLYQTLHEFAPLLVHCKKKMIGVNKTRISLKNTSEGWLMSSKDTQG